MYRIRPAVLLTALTTLAPSLCGQAGAGLDTPGVFEDHVLRRVPITNGSLRDVDIADLSGDTVPDLIYSAGDRVTQVDGRTATTIQLRGPTGSGTGRQLVLAATDSSGQKRIVILSSNNSTSHHLLIVPDLFGSPALASKTLPPDHGVITFAHAFQADADPEKEIVYGTRQAGGFLGAVATYDPGTDTVSTLATGDATGDIFGWRAAVVENPGSTDDVYVSAPGIDTLFRVTAQGTKTIAATLPTGSGLGNDFVEKVAANYLAVGSSDPMLFSATPNGRIDMFDPATNQMMPFDTGAPDIRFTSISQRNVSGALYYTRVQGANAHVLEQTGPGVPPVITVQAPAGAGLRVLREGSFRQFPQATPWTLPVFNYGQIDYYQPDGPADIRMPSRISSGLPATVSTDFGTAFAGATVVGFVSEAMPMTLPVPGLFDITFTPGILTEASFVLIPAAAVADNNGRASLTLFIPDLGLGNQVFPFSVGAVALHGSGQITANRSWAADHVIVR